MKQNKMFLKQNFVSETLRFGFANNILFRKHLVLKQNRIAIANFVSVTKSWPKQVLVTETKFVKNIAFHTDNLNLLSSCFVFVLNANYLIEICFGNKIQP